MPPKKGHQEISEKGEVRFEDVEHGKDGASKLAVHHQDRVTPLSSADEDPFIETPPKLLSSVSKASTPAKKSVSKKAVTKSSTTTKRPAPEVLPRPKRRKPIHLYAEHAKDYARYERAEKEKTSHDTSSRKVAKALQEDLAKSKFGYIRANAFWSLTYYYRVDQRENTGRDPDYTIRLGLMDKAIEALREDMDDEDFDFIEMDFRERMDIYVKRRGEIEEKAREVQAKREERKREKAAEKKKKEEEKEKELRK